MKVNSVYLAYPIDQAGPAHLVSLWEQIEKFKGLISSQVSWVFDPGDAFKVNPKRGIDQGLATINRAALNNADAVVAFLPAGVPSVGVPMEIDRARAQGKVVLVFTDADSYMLAMRGVARIDGWDDGALDQGFMWLVDQEVVDEYVAPTQPLPFTGMPSFTPQRHHKDDAGLDLVVSEATVLPGHTFVDIPCGISVQLPERHWAMITGRSSTLRKRNLLIHTGIIDCGYRGPLFAAAYNMGDDTVKVAEGERIAQLIVFYNNTMHLQPEQVADLMPSSRGTDGFGSTGA